MTVPARLSNTAPPATDGSSARARSYTAGFADALGDRQLVFDPASGTSLEILRFKPQFSESPEFEAALRARVEQLSHLQHPSLATVQTVERAELIGLSLISKHTSGRRVSELLPKAHGAAFALELIRLVTPALAALQRSGDDVADGALSAERIVVTRDGRLVVVEHVLGSAIQALNLSREQLHDMGIVVPIGPGPIKFDGRTDIIQLGFIGLSLLLGRRLDAADYPSKVPALLDEFVQTAGSPIVATKLRGWLERAMQISHRSFASAREAQDAFGDLPDDVDVRVAESSRSLLAFPAEVAHTPASSKATGRDQSAEKHSTQSASDPLVSDTFMAPQAAKRRMGMTGWIIAGLGVLAVGEGAALFVVPYLRPPAAAVELKSPESVAAAAPVLPAPPVTPSPTPVVTAPPATGGEAALTKPDAAATAATSAAAVVPAGPRFGGITVTSPIELQVFKDGQVVGTTAGPIAVNEGSQSLEFVNDTLGFRLRQTVNVKNGQMTSVKIAVPNGRISINAVPWAEVLIDGKDAGETPLANLALPIGTHEITFRHPQMGEKKQTVVVKVDGLLRVTQTFQQDSK